MSKRADPQAFVLRVTLQIAEVRREQGLTQSEVTSLLGTNLRNYQLIEAGLLRGGGQGGRSADSRAT